MIRHERRRMKALSSICERRHGFTLIELMVSIALALILILGVNQVFKITSDTITATHTLETEVRDHRAIQAVLAEDFKAAVQNPPFMVLDSGTTFMYRNREDELSDRDGNVATWAPRETTETNVGPYDYG